MKDLYYFAHPYTVKDKDGRNVFAAEEANFNLCCVRTAELLKRGYYVYSPIAHSHPIHARDPTFLKNGEYNLWVMLNKLIMDKTEFKGIILAPVWEASSGCRDEKERFEKEGLEVLFYKDIVKE